MEQFLVKQVKPNDFKLEARFTGDGTFYEVSHYVAGYEVETIEAGAFNWDMIEEFRINFVKLPSPDILIPSEEIKKQARRLENEYKDEEGRLSEESAGAFHGFIIGANWALSRLKELNPNLNF